MHFAGRLLFRFASAVGGAQKNAGQLGVESQTDSLLFV